MKVEPIDKKPSRYKSHWLRYVIGLNNNRMPKIMLNYGPNGRRGIGRHLKRLLDAAETSLSRSNSWRMMMMMMMILMVVLIPRKQPAVSPDRRLGGPCSHPGEHRISATRHQVCGAITIQTEIVICTSRNSQCKVTLSNFVSLQIIQYFVIALLDYL